jgi:hypothetical protein
MKNPVACVIDCLLDEMETEAMEKLIDYLLDEAKKNKEVRIIYCGETEDNLPLWQILSGKKHICLQSTREQIIQVLKVEVREYEKLKKIYKELGKSNRRLAKEMMKIAKKTLPKD